jgi:hypothetical protein
MPQIPVYRQQTTASSAGLGPGAAQAAPNVFQALAPAVEKFEQAQERRREERAAVAANQEEMDARSYWMTQLQERKKNAPAGAEGFTEQALKDYDADLNERIARAQTPTSKAWLRQRLAQARLGVQQDAMAFEAQSLGDLKIDGLNRGRDAARTAAQFRPSDFEQILEGQLTATAASGLPDQQRLERAAEDRAAIAEAAVSGLVSRDPRRALKELENETSEVPSVQALTFEARQRQRNAAEAEIRRLEAERKARDTEAKQAMTEHFRDMYVAAQQGLSVEPPAKGLLVALYGEREGLQRYQTGQKLAVLSQDVAKANQLTSDELIQSLATYKPQQVEGAAEQAQMQQAYAASVNGILDRRVKDPAGYLLQTSTAAQRAWEAMAADPEQASSYVAIVRAEKERLGIPGQALLPDSYVSAVADEIAGLPAERMADRLEQESQRWGTAWATVYGQLAAELPDTAAVIGSGIPKAAGTALASMARLKSSELQALLPTSTTMKDVDTQVAVEFEDFRRSMPAEAARTVGATLDAAKRLTIKYMGDGVSLGSAAQRAYRDLVTSQYDLRSLRGATMRIPQSVNVDAVEAAAQAQLTSFQVDSSMVTVPPGAALSQEEYASRLSAAIRDRGYWLTNPSSTGLRLYLDGQPVERRGAPVDVDWTTLSVGEALREKNARENIQQLFGTGGYLEPLGVQ